MPELPELEVIREVLLRHLPGKEIKGVEILPPGGPVVVRDLTHTGFEATLLGSHVTDILRRGKFLVFSFQAGVSPLYLAVNPKLSGRLQLAPPTTKRGAITSVVLSFDQGPDLRYLDPKKMGQLYLTRDLTGIPEYKTLGPEPFDISLDEFTKRLKPYRGEIKGVLIRGEFIAGIGNAYADEILWAARLHPYRKRTQLSVSETESLYMAMRSVLQDAIEKIRKEMQENIETEPRDFMAIHMKSGQPCPRCGTPISVISANQRITNFCRQCQPGGLFKDMS